MRRLVGLFALAISSSAFAGGVTDRPGLFSKEAKSQASTVIQDIADRAHEEVNVDVYDRAPSSSFASWAIQHAPEDSGIYVVISRNPGHVEVVVHNSEHFSSSDRQQMADALLSNFRNHDFDGGLLAMLSYASRQAHVAPVSVPQGRQHITGTVSLPPEANTSHGLAWYWWVLLLAAVGFGVYKMWQSFKTPQPEDQPPPKSPEEAPKKKSVETGTADKDLTPPSPSTTPPANPPQAQPAPVQQEAPSHHTTVIVNNQQPSNDSFISGAVAGVVLDDMLTRQQDAEYQREERRRRDEEDRRRREEDERRKRRDQDEEDARRRRNDDDSSSSSFDSGSSGGSFDSGSSGGGFDSGSSGGGFDSGSSGGDF